MTLPPEELQAFKALCDAPSIPAGPWRAVFIHDRWLVESSPVDTRETHGWQICELGPQAGMLAAFIAAARTMAPRLVEEVERLSHDLWHTTEERDRARKDEEDEVLNVMRLESRIAALEAENGRLRMALQDILAGKVSDDEHHPQGLGMSMAIRFLNIARAAFAAKEGR